MWKKEFYRYRIGDSAIYSKALLGLKEVKLPRNGRLIIDNCMNQKLYIQAGIVVFTTWLASANSISFSWLTVAQAQEIERLSPRIREYDSTRRNSSISVRDLLPFIPKITIFDDELDDAGEIISLFAANIGAKGTRIEVSGLEEHRGQSRFDIYSPCEYIESPDAFFYVGCLSRLTANATIVAQMPNAVILRIDKIYDPVSVGQKVIPRLNSSASPISKLHAIEHKVNGKIIHLLDGLAASAMHRVVVVDVGTEQDLVDGVILTIYRNNLDSEKFIDRQRPAWQNSTNPEIVPIGELVLFDIFEGKSLGIVTQSDKAIHLHDYVSN